VARVQRDEAAGRPRPLVDHLLEVLLAGALQAGVDRRLHRAARLGLAPDRGVLWAPERVDGDLRRAVDAAQVLVVGPLQAALADDRALMHALELLHLQLVAVDLPDAADELGGQRALRVAAQEAPLDVDAR